MKGATLFSSHVYNKNAFYIAPKTTIDYRTNNPTNIKPFYNILKNIQHLRREHKKGTILNAMYKEIGNGIYGNVCRVWVTKKYLIL